MKTHSQIDRQVAEIARKACQPDTEYPPKNEAGIDADPATRTIAREEAERRQRAANDLRAAVEQHASKSSPASTTAVQWPEGTPGTRPGVMSPSCRPVITDGHAALSPGHEAPSNPGVPFGHVPGPEGFTGPLGVAESVVRPDLPSFNKGSE